LPQSRKRFEANKQRCFVTAEVFVAVRQPSATMINGQRFAAVMTIGSV